MQHNYALAAGVQHPQRVCGLQAYLPCRANPQTKECLLPPLCMAYSQYVSRLQCSVWAFQLTSLPHHMCLWPSKGHHTMFYDLTMMSCQRDCEVAYMLWKPFSLSLVHVPNLSCAVLPRIGSLMLAFDA